MRQVITTKTSLGSTLDTAFKGMLHQSIDHRRFGTLPCTNHSRVVDYVDVFTPIKSVSKGAIVSVAMNKQCTWVCHYVVDLIQIDVVEKSLELSIHPQITHPQDYCR